MTTNTATNNGATKQDGDLVFAGASSGGFEVTPDGKAFSFRFSTFDATLEPTAIGAFAEHHEWIVMATSGHSSDAQMQVTVKGTVDTDPATAATLLVIANGTSATVDFGAGTHTGFDQNLTYTTGGAETDIRITVAVHLERDVRSSAAGSFGGRVALTVDAVHAVIFT